ncbi:hypothetical protein JL720_6614 [Aureococcus anophagefferens]|nr:hypothetical protein JL720_6614 [Aureococcus anophagefferens]
MVVGPALILVNKQLMTSYGFPYPMLISGIGQVSSAIGSFFVVKVFKWQPLSDQARSISWDFYRKNMVVVGAAFAASLCFGNAGYIYLTVSFVQILKAFTPCVVVLFLYLSGVEAPSRNVALSSAFEGLYLMAPICAAWMWGLALFLEVPKLRASGDFAKITENGDVFLIAALLGFAVNVASFLVIKRTSSVMVKLLGTARNAGLVLLSALALGEEVTAQQALGYGICLAPLNSRDVNRLVGEARGWDDVLAASTLLPLAGEETCSCEADPVHVRKRRSALKRVFAKLAQRCVGGARARRDVDRQAHGAQAAAAPVAVARDALADALYGDALRHDCALLNLYAKGEKAACKYHSDRARTYWHRENVVVSAGEPRRFCFRKIGRAGDDDHTFHLFHGDVVHMFGPCQDDYQHAVLAAEDDDTNDGDRVSIVFKKAIPAPGSGRLGHGVPRAATSARKAAPKAAARKKPGGDAPAVTFQDGWLRVQKVRPKCDHGDALVPGFALIAVGDERLPMPF